MAGVGEIAGVVSGGVGIVNGTMNCLPHLPDFDRWLADIAFEVYFRPLEPIRVASRAVALVNRLRRLSYDMCGQRLSERKVTLMLLAFRLENTIKAIENTIMAFELFCGSSALAAVIEEHLKQLEKTAEEVGKRVWSDKLHRMWETLTLKRIDKRIGELRTGISDIDNALALAASLRSLNQVGGMVDEAAPIDSLLIGFPKKV